MHLRYVYTIEKDKISEVVVEEEKKMNEEDFQQELPIAMTKTMKIAWLDNRGRRFILEQMRRSSFQIIEDEDSPIVAFKADPLRTVKLVFDQDMLRFSMKMEHTFVNLVKDPYALFLLMFYGEYSMLQQHAQEFIAERTTGSQPSERSQGIS